MPLGMQHGSFVIYPDGKYKEVKNLGWLLRNWQSVIKFRIKELSTDPYGWGAHMTAYLRDGRRFETNWADKSVLYDWIKRPVFIGLPVEVSSDDSHNYTKYEITRK